MPKQDAEEESGFVDLGSQNDNQEDIPKEL